MPEYYLETFLLKALFNYGLEFPLNESLPRPGELPGILVRTLPPQAQNRPGAAWQLPRLRFQKRPNYKPASRTNAD